MPDGRRSAFADALIDLVADLCCFNLCCVIFRRRVMSQYDFFLSYTQRDAEAKLLTTEIFRGLKELGKTCWMNVMMDTRDANARKDGVFASKCLLLIGTDNGKDSYFSREMCRQVGVVFAQT